MSIRSGETSRMVCAIATRPNISGVLAAASIRAMLRPSRYFTDSSSAVSAAILSTASANSSRCSVMAAIFCKPSSFALDGAVLVVERLPEHGPAAVDLAHPVPVVDTNIAVVGDVGAVTVHGAQGLDLDAGRIQRNQKHGQALVFRCVRVGVGDKENVGSIVCVRGEHLGAVDDPAVTVAHRTGLAGGDIGATFGLGVPKAQPEWPDSVRSSTSSLSSGEPNCSTARATIAVVPQWNQGVCARPISRSQMRLRTGLKPPSGSGLKSAAR